MCLCMAIATFQVSVFAEGENASNGVTVTPKLTLNSNASSENDVFGSGILTGTQFDSAGQCWDKGDNYKGYDDTNKNDIVCSFDDIIYNVHTTVSGLSENTSYNIYYEFTIPNDNELELTGTTVSSNITSNVNGNQKTYTVSKKLDSSDLSSGGSTNQFVLTVKNKQQGTVIKPTINVYVGTNENDNSNKKEVPNMQEVYVTSAPMYNIILSKKQENSMGIYDFNKKEEGFYANDLANNYKDTSSKVRGYKVNYGVALEVKRHGNGIRGVELPDPSKPFTFDIDLSKFTVAGKTASEQFIPLLYYVGKNVANGDAITDIPYSDYAASNNSVNKIYCDNSGKYTVTQEGSTLHVTVKDYSTNLDNFPYGTSDTLNKYRSGSDINSILDGVFSTMQLQVVYPYKRTTDNKTLSSEYAEANKETTINVEAVVKNMNAYSENGSDPSTVETVDTDNKQTAGWTMGAPGSRNHMIWYSTTASGNNKSWTTEYTSGMKFGQVDGDIAAVGAEDLGFTVSYDQTNMINESGTLDDIPVAIDQLVLFNRDAFSEVKLKQASQGGYKCKVTYGVANNKKALTNDSMRDKDLKLSDFTFYDSVEDLPDGYCDVVYIQYRGCSTSGNANLDLYTQFYSKLKANATIADKVYMVTAVTNSWNVSDLQKYENEVRTFVNKTSDQELTTTDWSNWVKNKTESDVDSLFKTITPSQNTIDNRSKYTIPQYNNGVYKNIENSSRSATYADGLYVVPYTTSITKHVAQQRENQPITTFNVSDKERYVDYKIDTKLHYWNRVTVPENQTTTVYLEDVLPKGLTYIKNSARWDATYTSQFPEKGKIEGGQQIEPTITNHKDGSTTLKWTITDVQLKDGALPTFYYSCKIGDENNMMNDVDNNDVLKNTIKVQTDEDKRPYSVDNDNIVNESITILKSDEFFIGKEGTKHLELQDTGDFNLTIKNSSSKPKNDVLAIDTMPQNNYDGTKMKGTYKITEMSIDKSTLDDDTSDIEVWYTSVDEFKEKKAEQITSDDINDDKWEKATLNVENDKIIISGDGLIGSWPKAIAYKDASLGGHKIVKLNIKYVADPGSIDDHLSNSFTTMDNGEQLEAKAKVDIVSRSLEGTVWVDKDKDGKLEDGEQRLENVKVTLYVEENGNYVPYTAYHQIKDGKDYQCSSVLYIDENGHYKFEGLPQGKYKVEFTSSDGTSLGHYEATIANKGTDEQSSKVTSENTTTKSTTDKRLVSGNIPNISMPSKEEMISTNQHEYNLPNQNLGLTVPSITISGTKTWNDQNNYDGLRPDSITLQIKNGDTVVKEIEVKKSEQWKWSAELPKYDEQEKEIQYTVAEKNVFGYTLAVNGYDITNTHTVTPLTIPVTKVWNDNDNNDKIRPDKVIVHLYADGKDTNETVELSEANQWHASFTGLDQYKEGKKIVYTVVEDEVKGYKVGITGSQDTGYVLTNTHGNETVEVKGTKTWDDQKDQDKVRPTKITIRLLADGKEIAVKEVTKETNWTYDFGNLAKYKDGKEIVYTISEDEVEGYKTSIKGFNITNSHIPTTPSKPSTDKPSKDDQNPKGDQSSKNEQPTNGQTPVVKGETKTTSKEQTNKIKTGDDTHLILYVLFVVVSFMGILFLKKKAHN